MPDKNDDTKETILDAFFQGVGDVAKDPVSLAKSAAMGVGGAIGIDIITGGDGGGSSGGGSQKSGK